MTNKLPFVSIVIPVLNEERYLGDCLNSLMNLDYPKSCFEIILVDNGSTDNTLIIAKKYPIKIFIKEKVKVGAVRNYGVIRAKGEVIAFLDSDCVVDSGWLTEGVKKLSVNDKLVLGGQYLTREDPSWFEKYWVLNNSKTKVYQTTLVGGCIFIPKLTFDRVRGFNESLNSGEDSDLTYRLKKSGFTVTIDPALSVVHLGIPSTLSSFIKRQIWHSADYISKFPASLKDKIFLLSCIFTLGLLSSLISLIFSFKALVLGLFLFLAPPALLSLKRVKRSKADIHTLFDFASVYCVDFLYLLGRSIGIAKGIKNIFTCGPESKTARR